MNIDRDVSARINKINILLEKTNLTANDTFLSGNLGLAYYYHEYYRYTRNDIFLEKFETIIKGIFNRLKSDNPRLFGMSLSSGAVGLGHVINYIEKNKILNTGFDSDMGFSELDKYIFFKATESIDNDCIDYLHGTFGALLFFAERKQTAIIGSYLDFLIKKVCARVVKTENGYWFKKSPPLAQVCSPALCVAYLCHSLTL